VILPHKTGDKVKLFKNKKNATDYAADFHVEQVSGKCVGNLLASLATKKQSQRTKYIPDVLNFPLRFFNNRTFKVHGAEA
jgi:hypothetical protein